VDDVADQIVDDGTYGAWYEHVDWALNCAELVLSEATKRYLKDSNGEVTEAVELA
jgi:hypothetical protein